MEEYKQYVPARSQKQKAKYCNNILEKGKLEGQ